MRIHHYNGGANANLILQKHTIKKNYDCFRCNIKEGVLTCTGVIVPEDGCMGYKVKIQQRRGGSPKVWIVDPEIQYDPKIHMFEEDNSLCLYDSREVPWKRSDFIHLNTIPWIAEWIVLYELYIIYGEWLGPEAPHDKII